VGDEPPSPDESFEESRDREEIEASRERLKRLQIWLNAAEEHLYPKPGSVISLAEGLRASNELDSLSRQGSEGEQLSALERAALEHKVRRFNDQIDRAKRTKDRAFFRRLSKACKLSDEDIQQPLNATGAAVLAFGKLGSELNRRPTKRDVRSRVDQWFKEGGLPPIGDRQWQRIFTQPFIAALFREG
jgi:hypothetical protein